MKDFCDGAIYKKHPVFMSHNLALQIVLYYDDVETANPLGSKAGNHKLGIYHVRICTLWWNVLENVKHYSVVADVISMMAFDKVYKQMFTIKTISYNMVLQSIWLCIYMHHLYVFI